MSGVGSMSNQRDVMEVLAELDVKKRVIAVEKFGDAGIAGVEGDDVECEDDDNTHTFTSLSIVR